MIFVILEFERIGIIHENVDAVSVVDDVCFIPMIYGTTITYVWSENVYMALYCF